MAISQDMGVTTITQIRKTKKGAIVDDGTKNLKGALGPICNNCAGLGFTNSLGGSSLGCRRCEGSGIEPIPNKELSRRIGNLENQMQEIKDLIIKFAKEKN